MNAAGFSALARAARVALALSGISEIPEPTALLTATRTLSFFPAWVEEWFPSGAMAADARICRFGVLRENPAARPRSSPTTVRNGGGPSNGDLRFGLHDHKADKAVARAKQFSWPHAPRPRSRLPAIFPGPRTGTRQRRLHTIILF
jgi:hypothetical protein